MLILSLETSALAGSCALMRDEKVLGEYFINNGLTHSKTLMPMVEAMLCTADMDISQVDLFAVAIGPGSFTGLRIGIATLKGLASPFHSPCVGVSVLEGLAQNVVHHRGLICACMDARCGQVYNAVFTSDGQHLERLCEDRAVTIDELFIELQKNNENDIILVGDGANLCYNTFNKLNNVFLAAENLIFQRASSIAMVAKRLFDEGKEEKAEALKPFYLRLPQAQRNVELRIEN